MQLKLRRSQRTGGVLGNTAIFCLDARAEFAPEEKANIARYKLGPQVIWSNAHAQQKQDAAVAAMREDKAMKGLALSLAGRFLHTNVTIDSLSRGQHIECKDLEELGAAEDALLEACSNLRLYLSMAATFDGREVMFDFNEVGEAARVAPNQSITYPTEPPPREEAKPAEPPPYNAAPPLAPQPPVATYDYSQANGPHHFHAQRDYLAEFQTFWRAQDTPIRIALIGGASVIFLYIFFHVF